MFSEDIITDRLKICPLSKEDSSFIFKLVNSAGWLRFIGDRNVRSLKDAEEYVGNILTNETINYWLVKLVDEGDSIGVVTLIKKDYLEYPDIGFAFLPEFEGKGYAFESTRAVLDIVKKHEGFETIIACTLPENVKSIQLLERLGLSSSGNIKVDGEYLLLFG